MRNVIVARIVVSIFGFLLAVQPAVARPAGVDGAILVRVADSENTHCINGSNESITFYLVRMFEQKTGNWIWQDRSVGLYINTILDGATGSGDATKK